MDFTESHIKIRKRCAGGNHLRRLGLSACAVLACSAPASAIDVVFDYRFDTNGMFNDPQKRQALEAAASVYQVFNDQLTAIEPTGSNTWALKINRPNGQGTTTLDNLAIAQDSVTIFVGGWSFHPSVLGFAGGGDVVDTQGDTAWEQTLAARGQAGALDSSPSDFGPWGGAITFNMNVDWHFDPLTEPTAGRPDFLTTAMHELGHILGFGEAPSWFQQVQGSNGSYSFAGAHTTALLGGPAELDGYASHWAEGTHSFVNGLPQETAMDPSTPPGNRQWMTDLDYAGFADIGWQVPEPTALMFMAMFFAGGIARRRA